MNIPPEMARRPVDHRGFPVPWFVTRKTADGRWDFVQIEAERFAEAERRDVCWVSGQPLGRFRSFVIGPMCVINRVSADPAIKRSVAEWSAQICPFLSRPLARRNESVPPEAWETQRGTAITANPGICAVYTVERAVRSEDGLFHLPDASSVTWWTCGRPATRTEVIEAIRGGLPVLRREAEREGGAAMSKLDQYLERARSALPAGA
jgi:hypothetical protein